MRGTRKVRVIPGGKHDPSSPKHDPKPSALDVAQGHRLWQMFVARLRARGKTLADVLQDTRDKRGMLHDLCFTSSESEVIEREWEGVAEALNRGARPWGKPTFQDATGEPSQRTLSEWGELISEAVSAVDSFVRQIESTLTKIMGCERRIMLCTDFLKDQCDGVEGRIEELDKYAAELVQACERERDKVVAIQERTVSHLLPWLVAASQAVCTAHTALTLLRSEEKRPVIPEGDLLLPLRSVHTISPNLPSLHAPHVAPPSSPDDFLRCSLQLREVVPEQQLRAVVVLQDFFFTFSGVSNASDLLSTPTSCDVLVTDSSVNITNATTSKSVKEANGYVSQSEGSIPSPVNSDSDPPPEAAHPAAAIVIVAVAVWGECPVTPTIPLGITLKSVVSGSSSGIHSPVMDWKDTTVPVLLTQRSGFQVLASDPLTPTATPTVSRPGSLGSNQFPHLSSWKRDSQFEPMPPPPSGHATGGTLVVSGKLTLQSDSWLVYEVVRVRRGGCVKVLGWNGYTGGHLLIKCMRFEVEEGGTIDLSGAGYHGGGQVSPDDSTQTRQGESETSCGTYSHLANGCGGGGGRAHPVLGSTGGGGGGGYGTVGGRGFASQYHVHSPSRKAPRDFHAQGGYSHHNTRPHLGAGGGGGHPLAPVLVDSEDDDTSSTLSDDQRCLAGGRGGGCLCVVADTFANHGKISCDGSDGEQGTVIGTSGGGGGAGGCILISCTSFTNTGTITARGGKGGEGPGIQVGKMLKGGSGGDGGDGLIMVGGTRPSASRVVPGNTVPAPLLRDPYP